MAISRREFCAAVGAATIAANQKLWAAENDSAYKIVAETDRRRILDAAHTYLGMEIQTVTAFHAADSPGGLHDFYSQADYFWPDPKNPTGPYINRDGQSNPQNFNDHRRVMVDLSMRMPALTAAWLLEKDPQYAKRAGDYLRAWFVTPATRMNPNLEFAQGVHGVSTGRSYGIIDTLHLVEVARAASFLRSPALSFEEMQGVKQWFRDYLSWMKTSEKGKQERTASNNHATCWALQASEFARLSGDETTRGEIHSWFIDNLLVNQLGLDGSFPKELVRTKPYSYSIFNFDVMAGLAQSLKESGTNRPGIKGAGADLTTFALLDGRGLCKAAEFLYPYLKDKSKWRYAKDVEHFDALPVRSPGLLFAGIACYRQEHTGQEHTGQEHIGQEYIGQEYIALWKRLNPDPTDREIIRNYPIRQPLLWV